MASRLGDHRASEPLPRAPLAIRVASRCWLSAPAAPEGRCGPRSELPPVGPVVTRVVNRFRGVAAGSAGMASGCRRTGRAAGVSGHSTARRWARETLSGRPRGGPFRGSGRSPGGGQGAEPPDSGRGGVGKATTRHPPAPKSRARAPPVTADRS
ncbi:hypothetical protein SMALB_4026 [Streptomyces malaysiensis]|uniref:Uncharacterized protein n=1 Tax=Streptomyces malaysiensis TaxID=92644 RepID=A0A7X5X5W9_STRMQ|nr:hypothetical protein [Streptomyces malaysiensis]